MMPQFHKSENCFCGLRCCWFEIVLRCFIHGEVAPSNQKLRAYFFYYCHFFIRENLKSFSAFYCASWCGGDDDESHYKMLEIPTEKLSGVA